MWLIAVPVTFAACVALHAITVRVFPGANRPLSFLFVGSLAGLAMLAAVASRYGVITTQMFGATVTYAFVCEIYLFLFSSALTSISMNLLVRLLSRPLSDAEIAEIYNGRRMVARRIERLIATGLLRTPERGCYEVTARGEKLLRVFGSIARFLRNDPSAAPKDRN